MARRTGVVHYINTKLRKSVVRGVRFARRNKVQRLARRRHALRGVEGGFPVQETHKRDGIGYRMASIVCVTGKASGQTGLC